MMSQYQVKERGCRSRCLPIPEFGKALPSLLWLLLGAVVFCSFLLGSPDLLNAADIRSTPHNLARKDASLEADEVCVFCHTPQLPQGLENVSGKAMQPAWQPSLALDHSFVMFDDIGRKQFGKLSVGSQSVACLSCHDANQAFLVTGGMSDHPFGVPYRGYTRGRDRTGAEEAGMGEGASRSARFLKYLDDFRQPSRGVVENRTVWWVSAGGASAVRSRADLPLYARQSDGGEIPYIECSSCHDPHVARPLFLRVNNEGSRLCLTCHDK